MSNLPEFVVDRVFNAPLALVWKAWTNPTHLQRWYGPGVETVIHEFDLTAGGEWRNEMKMASGSLYQKMIFQEINVLEKLVWHHCGTDENWQIGANPMMPDWPRMLLTTVSFSESDGQSSVRISQIPMQATEAEIACFTQMKDMMSGGWGKGYEVIDEILTELQST